MRANMILLNSGFIVKALYLFYTKQRNKKDKMKKNDNSFFISILFITFEDNINMDNILP
jgi:hypothetical protein